MIFFFDGDEGEGGEGGDGDEGDGDDAEAAARARHREKGMSTASWLRLMRRKSCSEGLDPAAKKVEMVSRVGKMDSSPLLGRASDCFFHTGNERPNAQV